MLTQHHMQTVDKNKNRTTAILQQVQEESGILELHQALSKVVFKPIPT